MTELKYRLSLLNHRLRYNHKFTSMVRAFIWFIIGHNSETCQKCGRRYLLWFAEHDLWDAVIGHYNGLRCPKCFDKEASRLGLVLEWNPSVVHPIYWRDYLQSQKEQAL